jgi:hypothetical protein
MTLTWDMALTSAISSRAASSKAGESGPGGLGRTARAPTRRVYIDVSTSWIAMLPVTIRIGVGTVIMISLVASKPSSRGMRRSMVTTSGRSRRVSSTASTPSRASPTTWTSGSLPRMAMSKARAVAESSATNTRIMEPSFQRS